MDVQGFLDEIRALYASGQTTEHSFRPALAKLFKAIDPALVVINEPKHLTDVGAPDFVFNRSEIAIGWCEAKDIGKDIRKFAAADYSKAQKERYKRGLPNLVYTNALDFEFIREGEVIDFITIADLAPNLPAKPDSFVALENRLRDFAATRPLSVTSSKKLAEMMAGKAAIIKDIMGRALVADTEAQAAGAGATDLVGQYEAFKSNLIHDITVEDFADVYAETIAYGLFAARLHDDTPDTFTRAESLELLPRTNPFLRELFIYIAGPNLDARLRRVIDELCNLFAATNMEKVLANFGKMTARQDPFLHFYEVFLAEYNPAKRTRRGVWYTPEPVVNFIVRAVDEVLKTEFKLDDGLADTSKIVINWDTGQNDKKGKPLTLKKTVHRVQVLDPATGTGTFLAEVVKLVAERVKGIAPGQWSSYVEKELIPRIHGFELLMASYAMCHMKLDMILTAQGYKPSTTASRLGVYLTNSLEEGERVEQTLFGLSRAIAEEGKAASDIKRQTPIMCVIGNPPYSGESSNKGDWIKGLMNAYKKEPGGKIKLNEKNTKWINKDEHKFIRLAEHMIDKNGEGILGFITSHGYLSDPTLRGMRWHLLKTFDKIYVLDLHGNNNKKEMSPDGSPDRNVFDIIQGVSIIIAVKRRHLSSTAKPLAKVYHGDLWGTREFKYDALWEGSPVTSCPTLLEHREPQYPFVTRDYSSDAAYSEGFSLSQLFGVLGNGIVTKRDSLSIKQSADEVWHVMQDFDQKSEDEVRRIHGLPKDVRDWRFDWAKSDVQRHLDRSFIKKINYRPFDQRWTLYTGNARGFLGWPVKQVMRHYIDGENIGLLVPKATRDQKFAHVFVTNLPTEAIFLSSLTGSNAMNLPLYLYPEEADLEQSIRVNFDRKLYARIRGAAGLTGPLIAPEPETGLTKSGDERPDEVKVFDYIYGALHSPEYRVVYQEQLKRDFSRVPFPASPEAFAVISDKGEALRRLHLMQDSAIGSHAYPFMGEGDSVVVTTRFETGRIWINASQYFSDVPEAAWKFAIGGYQPALKWLKDRKGEALGWNDIRHYQKIIKILAETDRIMQEIELPL